MRRIAVVLVLALLIVGGECRGVKRHSKRGPGRSGGPEGSGGGPMVGGPDSVPEFLKGGESGVGEPLYVTAPPPEIVTEALIEPVTAPMVGGPDSIPDFLKGGDSGVGEPLYVTAPPPEIVTEALIEPVTAPMVGGPDSIPDFLKGGSAVGEPLYVTAPPPEIVTEFLIEPVTAPIVGGPDSTPPPLYDDGNGLDEIVEDYPQQFANHPELINLVGYFAQLFKEFDAQIAELEIEIDLANEELANVQRLNNIQQGMNNELAETIQDLQSQLNEYKQIEEQEEELEVAIAARAFPAQKRWKHQARAIGQSNLNGKPTAPNGK